MEIQKLVLNQRAFFNTNATKSVEFRVNQLKRFREILQANEELIYESIYEDFGKSKFETYISELGMLYHEINSCIKRVKKWSKRKRVPTNLANFPARSFIIPEPLGCALVIGAWNYPIQIVLIPVVSALAAGNTVILKPSELASKTSNLLAQLINHNFPPDYLYVKEGGIQETTELLEQKFDKIFFTGSTSVGRIVYQAAAKNLTPVTLELGGKSPTFVLKDCDLKKTVQRIVWAKFLNAGQTCVAPDYVLVEKVIQEKFLSALVAEIRKNHPDTDEIYENYLRIIDEKNVERLNALLDQKKIFYGGKVNRENRFIGPTILNDVTFDDPIMKDEIFGPILPVVPFEDLNEAIATVREGEKPLACYIYSTNSEVTNKLLDELSFGGGAINDSIMHITNPSLPFGGVGYSGMGNYHGEAGFSTFTHYKSILHKANWLELNVKYLPYTKTKMRVLKFIFEGKVF